MWCGWFKLRLEIRHATALTTSAKHWHRQKAVCYIFVSVPQYFSTEPRQYTHLVGFVWRCGGKRKRLQDLEPFLWAGTDSNCRSREATDLQSARFNHLPTYPKFWASCRIRTNDPEITNHVLWPTELKRRLLVEAAVACFKRVQRYELFLKHQIISSFFAVFFQKKFISHHLSPFFAPKPPFPEPEGRS